MQKWEYRTLIHMWDADNQIFYWGTDPQNQQDLHEKLNQVGQDGWELVAVRTISVSSAFYHFKRPIAE